MNQELAKAIKHWDHIAPLIKPPKSNKEFNLLVARLDELLEIVGDDEEHHLIGLVDIISNLIATYEEKHHQKMHGKKGVDALKFLMDAHQLTQSDFPEIASQGVMSEILNEKRTLNLRQIKLFANRFGVEPTTFIDE